MLFKVALMLFSLALPAMGYPLLAHRACAQDSIVAVVNNEVITKKDLVDFTNFTRIQLSQKLAGPELELTDAEEYCAEARFCHPQGGTWRLVRQSDDPERRELAISQACNCPSGRLTAWKDGDPIEPELEPSIGVTEDPGAGVSGPLRVKGGIEIESADGTPYETRNRVTLCRCGHSKGKPLCDGSHRRVGFKD